MLITPNSNDHNTTNKHTTINEIDNNANHDNTYNNSNNNTYIISHTYIYIYIYICVYIYIHTYIYIVITLVQHDKHMPGTEMGGDGSIDIIDCSDIDQNVHSLRRSGISRILGRGVDTVGNPHRVRFVSFELFELLLLLDSDNQCSIERGTRGFQGYGLPIIRFRQVPRIDESRVLAGR